MFQLSKKVEYALIALRHMATMEKGHLFNVREIAQYYNISYELLSKIMQVLAKQGFLTSQQGVNGGYTLRIGPEKVTVSAVIKAIEGKPAVKIIQCETDHDEQCVIHTTCTIRDPLIKLQVSINKVFDQITLSELI